MNDLEQGLVLSGVGLVLVFSVLSLLAIVVQIVRRLDDRWQAAEAQAEEGMLQAEPTIDATTLVLISAAVATLMAGRGRIQRIQRILPGSSTGSAWSVRGRMGVQGSHTINRKGGI